MATTDPIKGGTNTTRDTTPVYDANLKYISSLSSKYDEGVNSYIENAFRSANYLPTISGKNGQNQIQNLDQLSQYYKDPKQRSLLLQQAEDLLDNSDDISDEDFLRLQGMRYQLESLRTNLLNSRIIHDQQLLKAALNADVAKNLDNWHRVLLKGDGTLRSEAEVAELIAKKKMVIIQRAEKEFKEQYPNVPRNPYHAVADNTRVARPFIKNPATGKIEQLPGPDPAVMSQEGYYTALDQKRQMVANKFKDINYQTLYKSLMNSYNDANLNSVNIQAASEGIMDKNQGGSQTALKNKEISFDIIDFKNKKNTESINNAINLIHKTKDNSNVIFLKGKYDMSDVPTKDQEDETARAIMAQFYDDMKTAYNAKKVSSESRPYGKITFQPIVAGDPNYHAYHIKINPKYFAGLQGSEDTPGIARSQEDIINNGITIIVPVEDAKNSIKMSQESLKGTEITSAEANLSLGKGFEYSIPGGGQMKINMDKNNKVSVTGYGVAYNPNLSYDTIPLNDQFQNYYNTSQDYNKATSQIVEDLANIALMNRKQKIADSQSRGERDPNKLRVFDPSKLQN